MAGTDLISRQKAINTAENMYRVCDTGNITDYKELVIEALEVLPSAEPEKTKAIPTARSCVDLAEKVTATFYDDEHEEWSQKSVTIEEVLDSVCDDYTILTSAERTGHWIECEDYDGDIYYECSECKEDFCLIDGTPADNLYFYCPNCGSHNPTIKRMEGEEE